MSGTGRGSGSGRSRGRYFRNPDVSTESSESARRFVGDGGHERPPRHLRGRAIGLWHAARSKKRREENEAAGISYDEERKKRAEDMFKRPIGSILISDTKKAKISELLHETAKNPGVSVTKDCTYEHLEETDFKHAFLTHITGNLVDKLKNVHHPIRNLVNIKHIDVSLQQDLIDKNQNKHYRVMQGIRDRLPSMKLRREILQMIQKHQVSVISGETGCGKTTQVAQFILDDFISKGRGSECKIVCTQPRRISAIAVAERVASERDEKLGKSVGYQIRLEKKMPRDQGSILFCTAGVLMKFMEGNPALGEVSHLILDEIHERDITSDFLITLLKEVIKYRKDIKVILMSATLNSEAFSRYYSRAPHINIPGFTYPVQEYFLEDVLQMTHFEFPVGRRTKENRNEWVSYIEPFLRQLEVEKKYDRRVIKELYKHESEQLNLELIFNLLTHICRTDNDDGAILIFVPGFMEISKISQRIRDSNEFSPRRYLVIPLHSQLPTIDQKQIFQPAERGMRKIIVSTNIAETSITIDDVTTVIDSGFIKISNLDPATGIETLKSEWVSQANAAQRKGRAGRVRPGVCFHLMTKCRYQLLDRFLKPEVLRKRLDSTILQLKMLQLGDAAPFLSELMDPPKTSSIEASLTLLKRLGALDELENLTPLGYHMAQLPVDPQCSKMLIFAALFSCLDPILSIAATLGFKDPHQLSVSEYREAEKKKYELSKGNLSDHLTMHYAIEGYLEARDPYRFCRQHYLSPPTLKMLINFRQDFAKHLFDMKFISSTSPTDPASNRNSSNVGLIKAIIAAGLYPNVAVIIKAGKMPARLKSLDFENMEFHPKSVLKQAHTFPSSLVVYHLRQKSSSLYIHDASVVFPLPIVFFGDNFKIHNPPHDSPSSFTGISINNKLRFICTDSTSEIVQKLRKRMNDCLEWKVGHPESVDWKSDSPEVKLLRAIMDLVTVENNEDLNLSDYDDN